MSGFVFSKPKDNCTVPTKSRRIRFSSEIFVLLLKHSFLHEVCRLHMCPLMASVTPRAGSAPRGVTQTVTHVAVHCQADGEGDVSARCQVGTYSIMHQAWALALAGAPL